MNKIIFGTTKEDDSTISGVESDPITNTKLSWKHDEKHMYCIEFDGTLYGATMKK